PDARAVALDAKVLGDQVAVDEGPRKPVAEGGQLTPARLERVELEQKVLQDQHPVHSVLLAAELSRDLLAGPQQVDLVVPRPPVGKVQGSQDFFGLEWHVREPPRRETTMLWISGGVALASRV